MRVHAWAFAAAAATVLLFACVGTSPTLPTSKCDGDETVNQYCNGACTNVQGDPRNCGSCGKTCNTQAGEVCQKGVCGPPCTGGTTRCGTGCLDVQNDPQNCGDCAKKCAAAESCSMGKCTLVCEMGLTACPRTASVSDGGTAEGGAGEGGTDGGGGPLSANVCTDTTADSFNCSKCGMACPSDKPYCDKGTCKKYKFAGIVTNLDQGDLASIWQECFVEVYNTNGTSLSSILTNKCPQANLMLGCRAINTKTLIVAAQGARADVTLDVGTGTYSNHIANGVAWYYNTSSSWGFFSPLDQVLRSSCDVASGMFNDQRLCWHTFNGNMGIGVNNGGYRCGTITNLNSSTAYERVILQAP
jgi:hypothetical protein